MRDTKSSEHLLPFMTFSWNTWRQISEASINLICVVEKHNQQNSAAVLTQQPQRVWNRTSQLWVVWEPNTLLSAAQPDQSEPSLLICLLCLKWPLFFIETYLIDKKKMLWYSNLDVFCYLFPLLMLSCILLSFMTKIWPYLYKCRVLTGLTEE